MFCRCPRAPNSSTEHEDVMRRCVGLRILIPGFPQWAWNQRERGLVLFGSFAVSLGVGLFIWGTRASLAILGFASLTHVVSVADVIRQRSFPGFGRWVPEASASAGLGVGCYGPAIAIALVCAWPGFRGDSLQEGYLINRSAYWAHDPGSGDWAWTHLPGYRNPHAVRVLAGPGQTVEWSESGLRVGGLGVPWTPPQASWRPREMSFKVPSGQVLVAAPVSPGKSEPKAATVCGVVLVDTDRISGRPWAKLYPIWDRALIH
jgi:hypothetical protein